MGTRAKALEDRFKAFHEELVAFVTDCPDGDWGKVCPGEQWPVGVVVRHIAAGHYSTLSLAKKMVSGETLPQLTQDGLNRMNSKHAAKHAGCTRDEVLELLRENGKAIADYLRGLSDADLDRSAHLDAVGGELTAEQLLANILILSGGEHLANVKAASGG